MSKIGNILFPFILSEMYAYVQIYVERHIYSHVNIHRGMYICIICMLSIYFQQPSFCLAGDLQLLSHCQHFPEYIVVKIEISFLLFVSQMYDGVLWRGRTCWDVSGWQFPSKLSGKKIKLEEKGTLIFLRVEQEKKEPLHKLLLFSC